MCTSARSRSDTTELPRHNGAPPMLGQHTDAVLREVLSMSQSEIDALRKKNVL